MCIQSLSQCGSTSNTPQAAATEGCVSAAMLCRVKSLLSHSGECLWLSLEESSQGWREAGRGWCRCGKGVGGWASGTAGICIPLSSVTGRERWRGSWARRSQGFGRTVAEIQESKMQCYKSLPSLLYCLAPVGRHRDTEINNVMSDSNTSEKEGAVNTFDPPIYYSNYKYSVFISQTVWKNVNHIFLLSYLCFVTVPVEAVKWYGIHNSKQSSTHCIIMHSYDLHTSILHCMHLDFQGFSLSTYCKFQCSQQWMHVSICSFLGLFQRNVISVNNPLTSTRSIRTVL